jgi:cell division protein FtsB
LHAHTVSNHQQLQASISGFHSNKQLESLARNELDMVVPGEILVRLQ